MSQKSTLNFDQWETLYAQKNTFTKKITENNCHLGYFADFIQTQKRYPTSLGKIGILT